MDNHQDEIARAINHRPQLRAAHFSEGALQDWFLQEETAALSRAIRYKAPGVAHFLFSAGYEGAEKPTLIALNEVRAVEDIVNDIDLNCEGAFFDKIHASHLYHNGSCIAYVDINGAGNVILRGEIGSGKIFATVNDAIESQFGPSMRLHDGHSYYVAMMDALGADPASPAALKQIFLNTDSKQPVPGGAQSAFYDVISGNSSAQQLKTPSFQAYFLELCNEICSNVPCTAPLIQDIAQIVRQFSDPTVHQPVVAATSQHIGPVEPDVLVQTSPTRKPR